MSHKMKPHKGLLKRVRVGGTGTIQRKKGGKGHLMTSKTGKRRRQLRKPVTVPKSQLTRIRRLLGMG